MTSHESRLLVLATALPLWMCGQTTVDLRTQSKSIDFGAAPFTRPFSTGTVLPATCTVGYIFYKSNAPAGQNVYGCTATNVWTLEAGGGGGGASAANQLADINPVRTSSTVATGTFSPNGTVFGGPSFSTDLTGALTVTLSSGGAAASTTFYLYWSLASPSSLVIDTSNSSFSGVTLTGVSQGNANAVGYPADVTPLFRLTAGNTSANQWDSWSSCAPNATTGCIDDRAWLGKTVVKAGTDMTSSVTNGVKTISADNAILTQKFFGSGAPGSIAGNLPGDLYSDTTNHNIYQCNAASGTSSPACTSVTSGGWTLLNGGGGGSSTVIDTVPVQGAFCNPGCDGAVGTPWVLPASNAATLAAGGTPYAGASIEFAASNAASATLIVPHGWTTGEVDLTVAWFGSNTSESLSYSIRTQCQGSNTNLWPAEGTFNPAQTLSWTTSATAFQVIYSTLSDLTMTGCAADELMYIQFTAPSGQTGNVFIPYIWAKFTRNLP
jgi:hypothetical protein